MKRERRILLVVTGLTPQVVTETLYCLAVTRRPPWIPTEVRLISTAEGVERARLTLLNGRAGWFERLRQEYKLPPIAFDEASLRVLRDAGGAPLQDIRTAEHNDAAADVLVREVQEATSDAGAEVHVSIAGGRKTMGFFAGYALSLYGRDRDALSHVLVEPPFESHPEFFYPTKEPRVIYTPPPESRPLDTSRARVTLAEIPFVRLRTWLPERGMRAGAKYAEVIDSVQQELNGGVVIDYERAELRIGETKVEMAPTELAFYAMVARASRSGGGVRYPGDVADEGLARAFLKEYEKVNAPKIDRERTRKALSQAMEGSYFLQKKSKVNGALRKALGERRARRYWICKREESGESLYVVDAGGVEIHFQG